MHKIKPIKVWENISKQELDNELKKAKIDVEKFWDYIRKTTDKNRETTNNHIKTKDLLKHYAGFIWFDKIEINIFPKIFENIENINAIDKLFTSLKYWAFLDIKKNKIFLNNHSSAKKNNKLPSYSTVDLFFHYYVNKVFDVFNKQIYHQYNLEKQDTPFIKGKIDFNEYFKNKISKGYFFKFKTSFFEYTHKNLFNKIVKKCLKIILLKLDRTDDNTNKIRQLLGYLWDVNDVNISEKDCDLINLYNAPSEFKIILQMSKNILQNSYFNGYGNFVGFSFLLNMYDVFEKFIRKQLENQEVEIEKEKKEYILTQETKEFNIKPDIVIVKDKLRIIADCKYKKKIKESDLYQLITYSYSLLNEKNESKSKKIEKVTSSSAILIYPLLESEINETFHKKLIIDDERKTNIHILKAPFLCNVETGEPDNISKFIDEIKNIVKNVVV